MSTSYGCAFGDETHKVNWLITRLQPAATISLCDEDFPVGIIPVLASELGVDGARLYDTIKRFVDREQAREAKEAARQPGPDLGDDPDGDNTPPEHDPGPEVDDEGGMSEVNPLDPEGEVTRQ
jgi:hypothetical protein